MRVLDWGLTDYKSCEERQLLLVEEVVQNPDAEALIFCSHRPVVTLGRASEATDLVGWQGDVVEVRRGGRATYHGSGQLIIYPIINLSKSNRQLPVQDIHQYLFFLEDVVAELLTSFKIPCVAGRMRPKSDGTTTTGVWTESGKKIASIGIAVKRWVTYHGVAINVLEDPLAFTGLRPCGFNNSVMTSMQTELGSIPSRELVTKRCIELFEERLNTNF